MAEPGDIILVDDDPHVLEATAQSLELGGFRVTAVSSGVEALRLIDRDWPGLVITDLRMPRLDGIELMQKIQRVDPQLPLILISGHADIADAVQALRKGAYDFLEKPFHTGRLCDCARRALAHRQLVLENRRLSGVANEQLQLSWIGSSQAAMLFREALSQAARDAEALTLLGERGSGKLLAATTVHRVGAATGHCTAVDCRAVDGETNWSKLLKSGERGTLILRHLDRANYGGLVALDRWMTEHTPNQLKLVATARKMPSLGNLAEPALPSSLFYTLTRRTIKVPNLASRVEDIPFLFKHFVAEECRRLGREAPMVSSAYLAELMTRSWPDNCRGLRGHCHTLLASDRELAELGEEEGVQSSERPTLPERVAAFEKRLIESELESQKGDIKRTYQGLGIARKTLYDKLEKYAIRREDFLP